MNGPPPFRSYVSPRSRARVTKILLIAGAIVSTVSMVLGALELGFPTLSPEDEVEDNPGGALVALLQLGLGPIQVLIYIATVVCFLMWLYRSYKNLPSFGTPSRNVRYSPGWAIGSFFIPFVNLVVPYRAVKELWRKSVPSAPAFLGNASPPTWFPLWWLFWLIAFRFQHPFPNGLSRRYSQRCHSYSRSDRGRADYHLRPSLRLLWLKK